MLESFESIFDGNLGDTPPAVSDASASVVSDSAFEASTSVEPPAVETSADETKVADDADEKAIEEDVAKAGEESTGEEPKLEETEEVTDEAIEKVLAGNKLGKWARTAIAHKSEQLSQAKTVLSEYETLGTKEEIQTAIEFKNNFSGFTEKDGQIVSNIPEFAAGLMAKEPDKAIDLFNSLVGLPNPQDPKKTIFETLLENPEVQARLKEQYQVSNAPETVPQDKHEAYQRLSPKLKEVYEYATDEERAALLEPAQREVEADRQRAQFAQAQQQKAEADFAVQVNTATETNFNAVTSQFDESLKAIPFSADEKQSSFLQFAVRDTVMTAATMAGSPAGEAALRALTEIGVQFPTDVPALVTKLETYTRYAEQFKAKNDTANFKRVAAEIGTIQQQLVGRSNKVAAQLAAYFGTKERESAEKKGDLLKQPTTARPVIKGNGGGAKPMTDYLDESFEQIMAVP